MHTHITKETRIELGVLLRAGYSLRASASILGVHHSSLSRGVRRNPSYRPNSIAGYHASDAQRRTQSRRLSANARFRKIVPGSSLEILIIQKLSLFFWAPEQIAGWLKATHRVFCVCAQTIYDWIYTTRKDLVSYLHCQKGRYRRTRQARLRKDKRALLEAPRNIANRSKHIEDRKTYGHWEGDTVHGAGKTGYIATFVERKSGYLMAHLLSTHQYRVTALPKLLLFV